MPATSTRSLLVAVAAAALALPGPIACDEGGGGGAGGAGGGGGSGGNRPICAVDDHSSAAKAIPLQLGIQYKAETFICPPQDEDWFRFELPAAMPLLSVTVSYPESAQSPVELAYELFLDGNTDVPVATASDDVTGDNRSSVSRNHFVGAAGGTYYLKVRDAGNDDQDGRNEYGVLVAAVSDPDPNEPNDDCASARPLTATGTGAISYQGDKDAWLVSVTGSKILDVIASAPAGVVDLQVTLLDADGNYLAAVADTFGDDGSNTQLRYGAKSDRPLCLIVEDANGDEADPALSYQLQLQVLDEADPNDVDVRNDDPYTATNLAGGGTSDGYLLSRGDLDWFKVDASPGQVVDVQVSCDGCADVDLTVALVYGHAGTPCNPGDPCDYLLEPLEGDTCESGIARQSSSGGSLCGLACEPCELPDDPDERARCPGDIDCPSFQCQSGAGINACTASGSCVLVAGGVGNCGVVQYNLTSAGGASQVVRTAQPALAYPTYVLVHDFHDDGFSNARYTIDVRVRADPDGNETGGLNNFYMPYTDVTDFGPILRRARDRATPAPWASNGATTPQMVASASGCIGFTGDVDIFRLEGGNPCGSGHCGLQLQWDYDTNGTGLDLKWFVTTGGMGPRFAFQSSSEGGDRVFGDDPCNGGSPVECAVYFQNDGEDYFVVIYDDNLDDWDFDGQHCYSWTITAAAAAGCPSTCPVPYEGDGLCTCGP